MTDHIKLLSKAMKHSFPDLMVCWPRSWIDAAVKSGFAMHGRDGEIIFVNDKIRDMLAQFATEILDAQDRK